MNCSQGCVLVAFAGLGYQADSVLDERLWNRYFCSTSSCHHEKCLVDLGLVLSVNVFTDCNVSRDLATKSSVMKVPSQTNLFDNEDLVVLSSFQSWSEYYGDSQQICYAT